MGEEALQEAGSLVGLVQGFEYPGSLEEEAQLGLGVLETVEFLQVGAEA